MNKRTVYRFCTRKSEDALPVGARVQPDSQQGDAHTEEGSKLRGQQEVIHRVSCKIGEYLGHRVYRVCPALLLMQV